MELRTMRVSTTDITRKGKARGTNDIFEKCRSFTRPSDLQSAGLYMYFEVFGDRDGCGPGEVRMGKRKVLMFGSNDYLDLITHPKVKEAAVHALKKYGSGCSGSTSRTSCTKRPPSFSAPAFKPTTPPSPP
jgi:7-keto-8-aminopelargonate synthetase-like enzyme